MGKMYCLVISDDYSRFSWVFFLAKKDETSGILRNFIIGIENQFNHRVKIIRSDNGTEFKNQDLNQFCNSKGIKREYSNARTPQQNGVAERKNKTLIEAARTMLVDSLLPIPFWAEAKFDGKANEGVLVGYSISSKAFRVYNHKTRKVEENLHINFLENQPNITGNGPKWLFDIDSLTNIMNYHPVSAGNRANVNAGIEINSDAGQAEKEKVPDQEYILLPLLHTSSYGPSNSEEAVSSPHDDVAGKKIDQEPTNEEDHTLKDDVDDMIHQEKMATKHPDDARSQFEEECDAQLCKGMRTRTSSTNSFNTVRTPLNTASASRTSYPAGTSSEPQLMPIDGSFSIDINDYPDDPLMPELEDTAEIHSTGIFGSAYDDSPNTPIDDQSVGAEADFNNMEPSINVSPIPTTRIHSIHPKDQIIRDPKSAVQTRRMAKKSEAGLVSFINKQIRTNHNDFQNCLFACFLSQAEPDKVNQALDDVSWVEAMHEELLQFKLLNVWTLVDLPKGKKTIGTKWVFRNKKDQRERLWQGTKPDWIEAIRLFLAYASYMDFTVYQMDVKSAFLYGTIEEEVYVNQPSSFEDPEFPNKVYKVEKALYGLHQAPRAWYETLSTYLLENGVRRDDIIFGSTKKSLSTEFEKLMYKRFQMSSMGELTFFLGLQVEQRKDGIFLSQDKYVYDILKKFRFTTVKTTSTPMETHKSLSSNAAEPDVDVHLYISMIGTLTYLTSSRPDIMFVVCACSRFQVTLKVSHMHAVKRIFRYLKGKPTLGLWYPKDSPMDLIAYSDSDYAGASIDRKSTTGGCQFLGSRLVSWQCKKQTIVANSTIEAEYIAASHYCGQVFVIKNPVSYSKTKHIEIRFHFIRDFYEKKLIEMVKIHTDNNVADLLTKAFDVTRFEFLIARIALASPKQMALVKTSSNLFMAGSLPKTIKQSNDPPLSRGYTLGSGEDSLELLELMLEFCDKHNMVAYLVKSESSEGFDEIIDFLTLIHIYYALTENPIIFVSLIEQFWETAVLSAIEEGLQAISATIDGYETLITEASLRRHLKLEDAKGIFSLSNEEIFEQLAHMGSKKTAWDQFSSNIATSIICLATSRRFNFSKFIFEAMVKNLDSPHKFLLYPRFIQLLLNKQQRLLLPHTRTYPTPILTSKLFSNIRRASKGYSGVVPPLFESMLVQAHDEEQQQSPSRITSSPSLSPQPTLPSPSPEPIQPTHEAEETASMPYDLPLHAVHSHGSAEGSMHQHDLTQTKKTYSTALTKLVLRVKKLAKIVLSDDEEIAEDSSKQERKISQIDEDPTISLVQDEEETPTKIIEEHGSGKKGEMEISTASPPKVTKISTVEAHVYTRKSAKDKGKAIIEESATPKKVKKRTLVQVSMNEETTRKMEEEERARFNAEQEARALQEEEEERLNLEAAWELQRQLDERQQVPTEATQSKGIDWNDPSVLRYHDLKNKYVSVAQARRNVITYLKNQGGSEVEKGKPDPVMIERKVVGTRRKTLARRRTSDKQVEYSSKRQKKEKESDEFDQEKKDLRMWLSVLKDKEEYVTPEFLSVRYPIVNWEYQLLGQMEIKDMEAYKLTRADGTVLRWRLYENSGVHSVSLTDTPMEINMLVEKKYPLKKEILEKMINLKLQAEEESTMAFKLIKFTRSQIEEKQ
ncbi:putative ribonuclease H-like domain-containing protein [Tanacetum coccineum]